MWPITWVTEFSSWITLTFPLWHVVREGIALDSMLTFKIYLGLARRPEADFNISYWASVNDSQAVKISNKARGSGSPGCTTYHHIACCWRHQVLRWWWIWRCCIWGYLAASSVNLMPSNRHRSPFPGAAAWPAHNNHISSLLYNLLLLLAHNNPMYVFRCYGFEPRTIHIT